MNDFKEKKKRSNASCIFKKDTITYDNYGSKGFWRVPV